MVKTSAILHSWLKTLNGRPSALSIELTKECPLRCPGCYAFTDGHVTPGVNLRQLSDFRGAELVDRVLALVDKERPLHVSLVGGDPLVRYRELEVLIPQILDRGIFVQVVTSAFRQLPPEWAEWPNFEAVVSIDGLAPEHDVRRSPATYARILKHISGQHVVVHCTATAPMARRADYLDEFVAFWSKNADVKKIWFSIFTPQLGADLPETPSPNERAAIVTALRRLRLEWPKLDMRPGALDSFAHPPQSPAKCVFAQVTKVYAADLKSTIGPCQFGGNPDCSRCGCVASMGLEAVAQHRLPGGLRAGTIFDLSQKIGHWRSA